MSYTGVYFHIEGFAQAEAGNQIEFPDQPRSYFSAHNIFGGTIRLNAVSSVRHVVAYNGPEVDSNGWTSIDSLKEMTRDFLDIHYFALGYFEPNCEGTRVLDMGFVFADANDAALFKLRCPHEVVVVEIPEENIIG